MTSDQDPRITGFNPAWIENIYQNLRAIEESATNIIEPWRRVKGENRLAWALKALTLTDLTTLAGDDTTSNVERLCLRAVYPLNDKSIADFQIEPEFQQLLHTAAVCVYPSRVADARRTLAQLNALDKVQIAAVATGFPSGSFPLSSRLEEIRFAIENGATEIDIVVDRSLVLTGQWKRLFEEVVAMRVVCGDRAHMKTILGIGECGTMANVYKASMVAMMAGSDFIKTSTGKEAVNATLTVGLVMIRAILEYRRLTGRKVGLKPAGGIRTTDDAIQWMVLIKQALGDEWLTPEWFRFGASGLLDDIVKNFA